MSGKIRIQVNVNLPGHAQGQIVEVSCDAHGNPLDLYWRRRLRDAKRDGCVEVVQPAKSKSTRKSGQRSKT